MAILAADPQWRRFPFEMSLSLSPAPYHNLHPRIARGTRGSNSWRHFMSQHSAQHLQLHSQLQQGLSASRAQEDWQFLIGNALHDDRIMAADEALRPTASSLDSVLLLRFLNYSRWAGGTKAITVTSGLLGPAVTSARDLVQYAQLVLEAMHEHRRRHLTRHPRFARLATDSSQLRPRHSPEATDRAPTGCASFTP